MVGTTLSHCKILEELGRGGMGIVYKAEYTKLDRPVAIKELLSQLGSTEEENKRLVRGTRSASALGVDLAFNFAGQVCKGLARAHDAGIIHRDIKPGNVIITDRGVAKIVDGGLASYSCIL